METDPNALTMQPSRAPGARPRRERASCEGRSSRGPRDRRNVTAMVSHLLGDDPDRRHVSAVGAHLPGMSDRRYVTAHLERQHGLAAPLLLGLERRAAVPVDDYLDNAADAVRLAQHTHSSSDKARLLELAEVWVDLAEKAHENSRRPRRPTILHRSCRRSWAVCRIEHRPHAAAKRHGLHLLRNASRALWRRGGDVLGFGNWQPSRSMCTQTQANDGRPKSWGWACRTKVGLITSGPLDRPCATASR
jgi:hypothetical protein